MPARQKTQEIRVQSLGQENLLQKDMAKPIPVFLPGESHGQRSLEGYSPKGLKESDTTKQQSMNTHTHIFLSHPFIIKVRKQLPSVMPRFCEGQTFQETLL